MIGLYLVLGILIAICCLLAYSVIAPKLKKYKIVEVKPKKKRAKSVKKKKGKFLQIRII